MLHDRLAPAFRRLVSGDPQGRPAWVQQMEAGDDAGLFAPDSAPWVVHGDVATLVGGVRALLMQTLHPLAMAGVAGHSRYRDDPLGRLVGTARWLSVTTFASTAQVQAEAARVRAMHARVTGTVQTPDGEVEYAASDPHLLGWVHASFTDSFLTAHLEFGSPIPGGPDAYVDQWAAAVELLGVQDPPRSQEQLAAALARYRTEVRVTPVTREAVQWLSHPPLGWPGQIGYTVLRNAAVALLDPADRAMLGLTAPPGSTQAAHAMLWAMRQVLGDMSPSEEAARTRLSRLAG